MNERIHIETETVRQFRRGDSDAFRKLVNRLMKPAYFHTLALLGNHDDAVDVSQKAFIRIWEARNSVDPKRPFYPWFYTILKRLCFNKQRNLSRRKETAMSRLPSWIEPEGGNDPSEEILKQEQNLMIEQALSSLGMNDREIIVLKDLEDYTYKDIASMLDIPVGTVMSRLYTARKRFKNQMEVAGYEHS